MVQQLEVNKKRMSAQYQLKTKLQESQNANNSLENELINLTEKLKNFNQLETKLQESQNANNSLENIFEKKCQELNILQDLNNQRPKDQDYGVRLIAAVIAYYESEIAMRNLSIKSLIEAS